MSRKPAHLERTGGKGARQRIWEALRASNGSTTYAELSRVSKVDIQPLTEYMRALARAGYIESPTPDDAPIGTAKVWMLIRRAGVEAPRVTAEGKPVTQGRGTENMWGTMRRLSSFNARELAAMSSADNVTVAEGTAKKYIAVLHVAGYLKLIQPAIQVGGKAGAIPARYQVVKPITGPRPPMIQRTRSLYDPNLGKVVWQEEPDHDAA